MPKIERIIGREILDSRGVPTVEAVVVAFLLGMVMSKIATEHYKLEKQLNTIAFGFLTPLFFFATGLKISLARIWENIWYILLLTIVVLATKFVSTYLVSRRFFPARAKYVSLLFASPLSIGIVASTVAYKFEVLNIKQFEVALGSVILISLFTALLVRWPRKIEILKVRRIKKLHENKYKNR